MPRPADPRGDPPEATTAAAAATAAAEADALGINTPPGAELGAASLGPVLYQTAGEPFPGAECRSRSLGPNTPPAAAATVAAADRAEPTDL